MHQLCYGQINCRLINRRNSIGNRFGFESGSSTFNECLALLCGRQAKRDRRMQECHLLPAQPTKLSCLRCRPRPWWLLVTPTQVLMPKHSQHFPVWGIAPHSLQHPSDACEIRGSRRSEPFDKFRQYRSLTLLIGGVYWPSYTLMSARQQTSLHCGGS